MSTDIKYLSSGKKYLHKLIMLQTETLQDFKARVSGAVAERTAVGQIADNSLYYDDKEKSLVAAVYYVPTQEELKKDIKMLSSECHDIVSSSLVTVGDLANVRRYLESINTITEFIKG